MDHNTDVELLPPDGRSHICHIHEVRLLKKKINISLVKKKINISTIFNLIVYKKSV